MEISQGGGGGFGRGSNNSLAATSIEDSPSFPCIFLVPALSKDAYRHSFWPELDVTSRVHSDKRLELNEAERERERRRERNLKE